MDIESVEMLNKGATPPCISPTSEEALNTCSQNSGLNQRFPRYFSRLARDRCRRSYGKRRFYDFLPISRSMRTAVSAPL